MREYRLWKERPKNYDFSLGQPDVSALDRPEQLQVLRVPAPEKKKGKGGKKGGGKKK